MIEKALLEGIWSDTTLHPEYVAQMRHVCAGAMVDGLPDLNTTATLATVPALLCCALGGAPRGLLPALAAWTLLRYAARLLDDVQDGDYAAHAATVPVALNVATGLLFSAERALDALEAYGAPPAVAADIRRAFHRAALHTCSGQHRDLTVTAPSLDDCWALVAAKSGAALGLINWVAGRLATDDPDRLAACREVGHRLGLLDQIRDDVQDLWSADGRRSDLGRLHRGALPVAYALSVLPAADGARLLALLAQAAGAADAADAAAADRAAAESAARAQIVASGAGLYLAVQSTLHYRHGLAALARVGGDSAETAPITAVFDQLRLTALPTP